MSEQKTEVIQEYVSSGNWRSKIDRLAGIIHDVKILGLESKNHRIYPVETLRRAVPLYENAHVNLNHPDGNPMESRKYQDRFGMIKNVRLVENEGLFGDFHFNPKHALAEQLLWDAENSPENVGFSHNVQAVLSEQNGQKIVEEIYLVRSVDLVADPATTSGLFEEIQTDTQYANHLKQDSSKNLDDSSNTDVQKKKFLYEPPQGTNSLEMNDCDSQEYSTEEEYFPNSTAKQDSSFNTEWPESKKFNGEEEKNLDGKITEEISDSAQKFSMKEDVLSAQDPIASDNRSELLEHLLTTVLSEGNHLHPIQKSIWNREFIKMILEISNTDLAKRLLTERCETAKLYEKYFSQIQESETITAASGITERNHDSFVSTEDFIKQIKDR